MRLGSKIIVSFLCISLLIITLGIVSQWYSGSIQNQLITNNIESTKLVEATSYLESNLYQSMISLTSIKDVTKTSVGELTLREPTSSMLESQFRDQIKTLLASLEVTRNFTKNVEAVSSVEMGTDFEALQERVNFYVMLSNGWLELKKEDREEADELFNTSINPYFRNKVIPIISGFREQTVLKQNIENDNLKNRLAQARFVIRVVWIICLILSFLIAFYVYKSIARPLRKLSESAQRIGEGNLEERISVSNSDEIGELAGSFNEMTESLKKRTLAKDYLDNIIETIRESLIVTDEKGKIVGINKAGLDMLHYKKEEILGLPVASFFDFDSVSEEEYISKKNKKDSFEFSLLTKRKAKIPVLFSEAELLNPKNEKVGMVYVAADITTQKETNLVIRESLKEKEVLLSEIHHRVKNNLAVVSGILQLQSYQTENEEVKEAIKESQSRIQSISLVHEMLYQSKTLAHINYQEYVNDLMQAISSMYINSGKDISLVSDIGSLSLNINQAIPCSLFLNEVIVNSFKHAFEETDNGKVSVSMFRKENQIHLIVEDDGIGIKSEEVFFSSNTLGVTLIKTLSSQLKGTVKVSKSESGKGTRTTLIFPKER